jgi:hypothetical protein
MRHSLGSNVRIKPKLNISIRGLEDNTSVAELRLRVNMDGQEKQARKEKKEWGRHGSIKKGSKLIRKACNLARYMDIGSSR